MIEIIAMSDISAAQEKDKENGLRLCPHCKGKAKLKALNRGTDLFIWVQCESCGARSHKHCASLRNDDDSIANIEMGVADVVDAWNRREV